MIRVILPAHLRTLSRTDGDVTLDLAAPVTLGAALDALETTYPVLCGTMRDRATGRRRAFVRFYACELDLSHEPMDVLLPPKVQVGDEPLLVVGAMAGG